MPTQSEIADLIKTPMESGHDMPEPLAKTFELVRKRFDLADQFHASFRKKWDHFYGLYRSYDSLKNDYRNAANSSERRAALDAAREWDDLMFIPYAFATIEAIVPRILARPPRMSVKPLRESVDASAATEPIRDLFHRRQAEIEYEEILDPTVRRGFMYGIGIQKTFHEHVTVKRPVVRESSLGQRLAAVLTGRSGYVADVEEQVVSSGPTAESVDPYDFFWDPAATSIKTAEWVIHRMWRSTEYVVKMVKSGKWLPVSIEALPGLASGQDHLAYRSARLDAQHINDNPGRSELHEVWEYHGGGRVITVLDRTLVVQDAPSPFYHGELPFQVWSPTPQPGEFVGIGEIEPIMDLQREINVIRTQRRLNAAYVVNQVVAYAQGAVSPENLKWGPGLAIPVRGQMSPRDAIMPLRTGDIPFSSANEEDRLIRDIEKVTGLTDALAGASGVGGDTATGQQIVQAALNVRVMLKARRLETALIKRAAWQWLEIWRQHVLDPEGIQIRVDKQDGSYSFVKITPEMLQQPVEVIPEAGSTEPDNAPQRKNDAAMLYNTLQSNPTVNQARLARWLADQFDVADADGWIEEQETLPVEVVGQTLEQALAQSMPPEQAEQLTTMIVDQARQIATGANGPMPEEAPNDEPVAA